MSTENLRRISIPVPNPALAAMLVGPRVAAEVDRLATEIALVYQANLPVITGNLASGVYHYIGIAGWGDARPDRWFGYVGNRAVSYRKTRGVRYAGMIEYGKPTKGIFTGRHTLNNAVATVLGDRAYIAPSYARDMPPTARAYGDVNPKTGTPNYRTPSGRFAPSPKGSRLPRKKK